MQTFKVQGMTCGHCVKAVTHAIQQADPAADVQVDLAGATVQVQSELPAERVVELITAEGYQAQSV